MWEIGEIVGLEYQGLSKGVSMKEFGSEIYSAVVSGRLEEPFNAAQVKRACPGWADKTYHTFLGKHRAGNGMETELFVRTGRGLYKLNKPK